MAGIFELLAGAGSAVGQVIILGGFVVTANAAATAHNILANQTLYRFGFLIAVAAVAFNLAWGLVIYELLQPISGTIARLGLLAAITNSTLEAVTALLQVAPLLVLQSDSQATSLAYAFLKLNTAAFQMQLVFFGLWCVLTGYLVWRSAFMPRVLGALLMVDGLGWMLYLWPPLATQLFPLIALASGLAEIPMIVWLIAFGVNSERWRLQAAATLA
jgi:hypothetical protein